MLIYKKVREWQNERLTDSPLQRKKHDLAGYTEAYLLARRTHTVGCNHSCTLGCSITTFEETTAIDTVPYGSIQAEKTHLTPVGMPREDNINLNGGTFGIIRGVRKQNDKSIIGNGINALQHDIITREAVTHTRNEQLAASRIHTRYAV